MKGEIIGSVRIGNTVYKAGQEDELAAVASADEIKRLTEKGVIAGFSGKSKADDAAEASAAESGEEAAAKGAKKPKG